VVKAMPGLITAPNSGLLHKNNKNTGSKWCTPKKYFKKLTDNNNIQKEFAISKFDYTDTQMVCRLKIVLL